MFLSDKTIAQMLENRELIISPFDKKDLRSAGVRLHLGSEVLIYDDNQKVDLLEAKDIDYQTVNIEKEEFFINPNQFVLAHSREEIRTPRDVIGFLDGRSTVARLGLTTHITAAVIDGMYEEPRTITLEIKNNSNLRIRLCEGLPIGMLLFARLDKDVCQDVQSQYKNQKGVAPPNFKGQLK